MTWPTQPISEIAAFVGGGTPSKSRAEFWTGSIPWVSPKDMHSREIFDAEDHVTPEAVASSATQMVPSGSVLIVARSGILARHLPIAIARRPIALNQDMKALLPTAEVLPDYLAYAIESRAGSILTECVKRGATVHSLDISKFRALPIPIPPLPEQRRIVETLDEADGLRKLRAEADAKAERILPALFIKMFGNQEIKKKALGDIVRLKSGAFLPAKQMESGGYFPVFGGNGIAGYHTAFLLENPVVVVGRVGAYCGVVHYAPPRSWITDNALYVAEKLLPVEDRFLEYALKWLNLNQYAGRAGQPLISGGRIYPLEIPYPALDRQRGFSAAAESVHALITKMRRARDSMDEISKALLYRSFSGALTHENSDQRNAPVRIL